MDFSKDREAALHNATLLGGVIKPASVLLLGAPPENAAAASLPLQLLNAEVCRACLTCTPADCIALVFLKLDMPAF